MRRLLAIALLSLTSACAFIPDDIQVRSPPPEGVQRVAGAEGVAVTVEARDGRTSNRDRVGVKKNGYGIELASIRAANDVVAELRQTVVAVLAAQGFATGDRDGRVDVELLRFYNDFKPGFFSGGAVADVQANLRVLDRGGRVTYSRVYGVEGQVPTLFIMGGDNAQLSLEDGLRRLSRAIAEDGDLARALTALPAPPPAPEPVPTTPVRRRGRVTS